MVHCAGSGWTWQGGTLAYIAPELLLSIRTKRPADAPPCFKLHGPPVDCWAYGVVALELLTGCCLFQPNTRARPCEEFTCPEDYTTWDWRYTADLHGQWVCAVPYALLSSATCCHACRCGSARRRAFHPCHGLHLGLSNVSCISPMACKEAEDKQLLSPIIGERTWLHCLFSSLGKLLFRCESPFSFPINMTWP